MSKHARIRRLRAEREAAKAAGEEKERGPISETDAVNRSREWRQAGLTRGHWAFGSRTRKDIKQRSVFKDKAPKKTRDKKRGRR
jgi:hypothetical protein